MEEHEHWTPLKWMYRKRYPPDDDAYFENMIRVIFIAGLNWRMIDRKWSNFQRAFNNFSVNKVAEFDSNDIERLVKDTGIVRNRAKIIASINNARQFQKIRQEHGDFQSYLDSIDKTENYKLVIKDLEKRFNRIGPASARIFLFSVGEKITPSEE